jgi:hypothetical protein
MPGDNMDPKERWLILHVHGVLGRSCAHPLLLKHRLQHRQEFSDLINGRTDNQLF